MAGENTMNGINIELTETDRVVLSSYARMLDGLSLYLGDGYEIVLHSLEDCSHSAIKVINGFHTGRKEGAPITDLALEILEQIRREQKDSGKVQNIIYFSRNKSGEPLRSTTIAIRGERERIIGLLCINFYLNTPLAQVLEELSPQNGDLNRDLTEKRIHPAAILENFSANSQELVEEMVEQVRREVYGDDSVPTQKKTAKSFIA